MHPTLCENSCRMRSMSSMKGLGYSGPQFCLTDRSSISTSSSRKNDMFHEDYCEKRLRESNDYEALISSLKFFNLERDYWVKLTQRVESNDLVERFEGTRQFRMMLSVSGEIPIQDVIDTGIVPRLVQFLSDQSYPNLQFEAAWALTNVASGTCQQTEVVVSANAIPHFANLLLNEREDLREQGMWGLGNIAGDRFEYRDMILIIPMVIERFIDSCKLSSKVSTIRTGVWSLSNLCRGKPQPMFHLISSLIPYLADVLETSNDPDTLSDTCWALDGLSEHSAGLTAIINNGIIMLLTRLLTHKDLMVQRPALRIIGQIAAGNAEQTQHVVVPHLMKSLIVLLNSSRKSIRKDACWTLSNIAAGTPLQLQELINFDLIPCLIVIYKSDPEPEVKKEAAWAVCNACTTVRDDQLEYLVSNQCIRHLASMLCFDDPKILEVVLEALSNILKFGEKIRRILGQTSNLCLNLLRECDGVHQIAELHSVHQGYGSFVVWQKAGLILDQWFSELF